MSVHLCAPAVGMGAWQAGKLNRWNERALTSQRHGVIDKLLFVITAAVQHL